MTVGSSLALRADPASMTSGMGSITEITLLGGQRHRVDGNVKEVEQLILSAARGSIMQLAWFTDVQTAEPLGINPEHVMTLRPVESSGPPTASPDAG
jgi:hypothetical protein